MERMKRIAAVVIMSTGLVATPMVAFADTTVQNSNSSENAHAESGDASSSNSTTVEQGPESNSAGGDANSQQIGNNSSDVEQDSEAKSGDAAAGSQVTGAKGGDGDTTVQNNNHAVNPTAVSGNANAHNFASVDQGPEANALFGSASASQIGDNDSGLEQKAQAESGDAVSGSQITGIF